MKTQFKTKLFFTLLFLVTVNCLFAIHPTTIIHPVFDSGLVDSLVLEKNNGKSIVIHQGDKVKIWKENEHLKGIFKGKNDSSLILEVDGKEQRISLDEINKFQFIHNSFRTVLGSIIMGLGWIGFGYTAFALIFGLIGLVKGDLSGVAIILVVPLGLLALGLFALGSALLGRKYNLKKRWHFRK